MYAGLWGRRIIIGGAGIVIAFLGCLLTLPLAAQTPAFDLAQALDDAQPGAVLVVPSGNYAGSIKIDKPVTLIGEDWPTIQGSGKGDVITVTAPDVTIRGFVIRGSGEHLHRENAGVTGLAPRLTVEGNRFEDVLFGVYLKEAPMGVIRDNLVHAKPLDVARRGDGIRVWYSEGTLVEGNRVEGSRDLVIWFSPKSVVRDNEVSEGRYGIHTMFSDDLIVEDNVVHHNSVGAFLMYGRALTLRNNLLYNNRGPSGYGVGLKDVDDVVAEGNRLVANRIGLYVDNSPREPDASLSFARNLLAYNDIGLNMLPLVKRNTYSENIFHENGEQMALQGSGQLTDNHFSRDGRGNYWSDYVGFDADGDHVGDLPYHAQSLYEDLLESYPQLRLFRMSPSTEALDFAARAFPIFKPRRKISDMHPLMAPPALPAMSDLPLPPLVANVVAALALVALALAILAVGLRTGMARAGR